MTTVSIVESLRQQITSCETQLVHLRQQLAEAEHLQQQRRLREGEDCVRRNANDDPLAHDMTYGVHDDFRSEIFAALSHAEEKQQEPSVRKWPLDHTEYKRYGRQLIMPEIGLQGTIFVPFA